MLLNAFPEIGWLKQQIATGFKSRQGYNGVQLKTDGWPTVVLNTKGIGCERNAIQGPFSLFTNLRGSSFVRLAGRELKIDQGYFALTNPGDVYSLRIEKSDETETFNLHYGEADYNQMLNALLQKHSKLLDDWGSNSETRLRFPFHSIPSDTELIALIERIRKSYQYEDSTVQDELFFELVLRILVKMHKQFHAPFPDGPKNRIVKQELIDRLHCARDYMHGNYNQAPTLDSIAQSAFLSKYHFLRLFHSYFGITPNQYLQQLRINKAKELLATKQLSMEEIAQRVGYSYGNSLAKLLRKNHDVITGPSQ